ncbi:MAG: hypothetical protein A2X94_02280 [Bdellovibrionales bacterium GWB1_55_8]|nr:MAG: hypothetical protein A2X94_02280 [Bdellovibrionales bacterium GWB1_55_8]
MLFTAFAGSVFAGGNMPFMFMPLPTVSTSSDNVLMLNLNEASASGDRVFLDSSPSGFIATCASATCPSTIASASGNYLRFAWGQFLTLGTQVSQAFTGITVSVWTRNPDGQMFERGVWNNEDGFGLVITSGNYQFGHWFGGTGYPTYNLPLNSAVPADSAWHHVVGTMSPVGDGTTQWKIYTDGVLTASVIDKRTITASVATTTLGRRATEARYFTGDVSSLGIWNRALNATEVQNLYQSQNIILTY